MWLTFAIILATVILLATDWLRLEVTCVGTIVSFLLLFNFFPILDTNGNNLVSPEKLLAGLADPALVSIICLLIVGQGLFHTSALEGPARFLARQSTKYAHLTLILVLVFAGIMSAFMNNTPVVVMFIPIVTAIATRMDSTAANTLMPLSFLCILGGMTTLIGSSTNLLVAGQVVANGLNPIGFFDFTAIGLVLAFAGGLYVVFVMPHLLKQRIRLTDEVAEYGGKQYIAQIDITHDHPLVGSQAVAGMFPALKDMTVRLVQRGEHPFLPPFDDITLEPGDEVVVAATRNVLTETLKARSAILSVGPEDDDDDEETVAPQKRGELILAEAIVAPGSRMIGRTVETSGLHADTGCIVLGIQRRSRMIRLGLNEIRLESGDVLLVMGSPRSMSRLKFNRDILLMEWSATELPRTALALRALVIFGGVIVSAATGLIPIVIAALAGALLMIPAGCLNVRQAARAFDQRIYLLIGASLAMAVPLQATGGAMFLANSMFDAFAGAPPAVMLSAMFALVAVLTNFLSNNASAVLFTPIAIGFAARIGVDPMPFVVAVIFASNCSFATPFGYQTNLLVMAPGSYKFTDFVRAGIPLVIIVWLAFSMVAPWYYNL